MILYIVPVFRQATPLCVKCHHRKSVFMLLMCISPAFTSPDIAIGFTGQSAFMLCWLFLCVFLCVHGLVCQNPLTETSWSFLRCSLSSFILMNSSIPKSEPHLLEIWQNSYCISRQLFKKTQYFCLYKCIAYYCFVKFYFQSGYVPFWQIAVCCDFIVFWIQVQFQAQVAKYRLREKQREV